MSFGDEDEVMALLRTMNKKLECAMNDCQRAMAENERVRKAKRQELQSVMDDCRSAKLKNELVLQGYQRAEDDDKHMKAARRRVQRKSRVVSPLEEIPVVKPAEDTMIVKSPDST
jgi:hypothetical protein